MPPNKLHQVIMQRLHKLTHTQLHRLPLLHQGESTSVHRYERNGLSLAIKIRKYAPPGCSSYTEWGAYDAIGFLEYHSEQGLSLPKYYGSFGIREDNMPVAPATPASEMVLVFEYFATTLDCFLTCDSVGGLYHPHLTHQQWALLLTNVLHTLSLVSAYGISHRDVHTGNIMVHPGTLHVGIVGWSHNHTRLHGNKAMINPLDHGAINLTKLNRHLTHYLNQSIRPGDRTPQLSDTLNIIERGIVPNSVVFDLVLRTAKAFFLYSPTEFYYGTFDPCGM